MWMWFPFVFCGVYRACDGNKRLKALKVCQSLGNVSFPSHSDQFLLSQLEGLCFLISFVRVFIPHWPYAFVIDITLTLLRFILRRRLLETFGSWLIFFSEYLTVLSSSALCLCPDHGGVQLSAQRPVRKHHQRGPGAAEIGLQRGHPRGSEQQHNVLQRVVQLPGGERQARTRWAKALFTYSWLICLLD